MIRQALTFLLQDGYFVVTIALAGSFVYFLYEQVADWYVNRQWKQDNNR